MKISTKGRYGLRAMIDLAVYSESEPVSIQSIAERQGISERYLEQLMASLKKARLVANPGCYTTCSILTIYPLAKEGIIDMNTLIVDAKSGTSGAGRGAYRL